MQKTQIELVTSEAKGVNNGIVVKVKGDIDSTTATYFSEEIFGILNNDGKVNIIADLQDLRYVNSTGLGAFLNITKSVRIKGGVFAICNVNDNISDVIDIIGATAALNIYPNVAKAIEALAKK
ncbi:MAG: STAS domain-containing protein [Chitinivibrionia bacterium]|jgi:anti-anti-sigma factor|nr:STAS domain-containing protein [Chitinivibrionia bacterium]